MPSQKVCEGFDPGHCNRPRVKGERYCLACRSMMLRKMRDSGYFVKVGNNDTNHDEDTDAENDERLEIGRLMIDGRLGD